MKGRILGPATFEQKRQMKILMDKIRRGKAVSRLQNFFPKGAIKIQVGFRTCQTPDPRIYEYR
jgi:hypothetical protein